MYKTHSKTIWRGILTLWAKNVISILAFQAILEEQNFIGTLAKNFYLGIRFWCILKEEPLDYTFLVTQI